VFQGTASIGIKLIQSVQNLRDPLRRYRVVARGADGG
jgi:hypothetical protein